MKIISSFVFILLLVISVITSTHAGKREEAYNLQTLLKTAENGTPDDQFKYAVALFQATRSTPSINNKVKEEKKRKLSEVVYWYKKAAESGHVKAKANAGHVLLQDLERAGQAVPYLEDAANAGDIQAAFRLAKYYDPNHGWSNEPSDIDKAISLYSKVAKEGSIQSQNRLGVLLYSKNNLVESYVWLLIAKMSKLEIGAMKIYNALEKKLLSLQKTEAEKKALVIMKNHPNYNQIKYLNGFHQYNEVFGKAPPKI